MDLSCRVIDSQPGILDETARPDIIPSAGPDIDAERSAGPPAAFGPGTIAKCGINGLAATVVTVDDGRICTEDVRRAPDPTGLRGK